MTSIATAPAFTLQLDHLETTISPDVHFYAHYDWTIDAAPPLRQLSSYFARELARYVDAPPDWRRDECANNIFLLACAIADTVDDVILGSKYDFSKITGVFSFLSPATSAAQKALATIDDAQHWRSRRALVSWRKKWDSCVNTLLKHTLLRASAPTADLPSIIEPATDLLAGLPSVVQHCRPRIPAAFRSQDLSHFDVLKLGDKFMAAHPDRKAPLLIIGLRTAGSYFAPLLCGYLETHGYLRVACVTVRPNRGIAEWELTRIHESAQAHCTGIVIDEPVGTGKTFAKGVALLNEAGVPSNRIYVLIPVHRNGQQWRLTPEAQALSTTHLLTLSPGEWHKDRFFESSRPQEVISEYFRAQGWTEVFCADAEHFNDEIRAMFHTRLKRVFAVRLASSDHAETRYVIAKSVGWGWLGYHSFIAGLRLQGAVPRVLALREGTLFSEWVVSEPPLNRAALVARHADHALQATWNRGWYIRRH